MLPFVPANLKSNGKNYSQIVKIPFYSKKPLRINNGFLSIQNCKIEHLPIGNILLKHYKINAQ